MYLVADNLILTIVEGTVGVGITLVLFFRLTCTEPGILPKASQLPPDHPLLQPPDSTAQQDPHYQPVNFTPQSSLDTNSSSSSAQIRTSDLSGPHSLQQGSTETQENLSSSNSITTHTTETHNITVEYSSPSDPPLNAPTTLPSNTLSAPIPSHLNQPPLIGGRFCKVCRIWRPEGCKHCYECGNCVLGFDHHCPVVNNCIGERNQVFFMLFLCSCGVSCTLYAVTVVVYLVLHTIHDSQYFVCFSLCISIYISSLFYSNSVVLSYIIFYYIL